jgi:hypothetical protein
MNYPQLNGMASSQTTGCHRQVQTHKLRQNIKGTGVSSDQNLNQGLNYWNPRFRIVQFWISRIP